MPRKTKPARKIADTIADPTLPKTPVQIGQQSYNLCFDYAALAESEQQLLREGHNVSVLRDMPVLNLASVRALFPVAVRRFHPELSFEDAQALITIVTCYPVAIAIRDAWNAAVREMGLEGEADPVPAQNPPRP